MSALWSLSLSCVICVGAQEAPNKDPFEVLVEAAIEEANFSETSSGGAPVFIDLQSFKNGFRTLREAGLLSVHEQQAQVGGLEVRALDNAFESVVEKYESKGRGKWRIRDGGMHLELKSAIGSGTGFRARLISRVHTPNHMPATLCPREVDFTLSRVPDGNWTVTGIRVLNIC